MSFDDAFAALESIIDREGDVRDALRNEAQTRFDLIDSILESVLEWPVASTRVEQAVDGGGFTDYELVEEGTLAVVEAKRENISFSLPLDLQDGVCRLSPIVGDRKNIALKSALLQVMRYSSQRGVAPCVVTNGLQWVAFLASRNDGTAPLEGKALVLPSLEALRDNFVLFYNCLSEQGLKSRRLFAELSVGVPAPPAPLSASLSNYPGTKRRNPVQTNLQVLGQLLLEDMPREEQYAEMFLRECYAQSGALSSYAEISRDLLMSRNTAILSDLGSIESPASLRRGLNPALSEEAVAAAASHRPIVLLGGVGVGKSTFIQHLVHIDAKTVFTNAIAITVDYGRGAVFDSPASYAVTRIRGELFDKHGIDVDDAKFVDDLYKRDLEKWDRSVLGRLKEVDASLYAVEKIKFLNDLVSSEAEHLRRSINRIVQSRRRQIVIFLDNVDQRGQEDQNQVFLASNELAAAWDATVFVTLRPETYYESQRYGAVSGYHPRVFSIAPPRSDVMLTKRVDFALKILTAGGDVRTASASVGIQSKNLEMFLRVLESNFSKNRSLMSLIDNLAGGNMRRALDFITQFIGSGHIDTLKIIGVEERDPGTYIIPMHEFLRSLIHGDGEYYDPHISPIANLFVLDRPQSRNHFLSPIILDYILSRGDARDGAGYIALGEVYRQLQGLGYEIDAINFTLEHLGQFKLIEAPLADFQLSSTSQVRITTIGAYTLKNLPSLFTYCDAMIVDIPIIDPQFRFQIKDARTLPERLSRVSIFREYLDACWQSSGLEAAGWSWETASRTLKGELEEIARRAAR